MCRIGFLISNDLSELAYRVISGQVNIGKRNKNLIIPVKSIFIQFLPTAIRHLK